MSALSNVFGTKPENAIFLPTVPYAVRFNCQAGQIALSETEFLGSEAEISIIKVSCWFGALGKTRATEWFQLFYVPAPTCKILPANTVCVSYIKTRSIGQFQQCVTRLMGNGVNPAEGIFKLGFQRHSAGDRTYYSVTWDWRARKGKAEQDQLQQLIAFMEAQPDLADMTGTRQMVNVDGLSSMMVQQLIHHAQCNPDLEPLQILEAMTADLPQLTA